MKLEWQIAGALLLVEQTEPGPGTYRTTSLTLLAASVDLSLTTLLNEMMWSRSCWQETMADQPKSHCHQNQKSEFFLLLCSFRGRSSYELSHRRKHFGRKPLKTMGLEAMLPREIPDNIMMNMEKMSLELSSPVSRMPLSAKTIDNSSAEAEVDSDNQMQLFLQVRLSKGTSAFSLLCAVNRILTGTEK